MLEMMPLLNPLSLGHGQSVTLPVFSDYSLLENSDTQRMLSTKIARFAAMFWKRHLLAPATRHTNIQDQGRRQQETHTPTAKTVYRKNDRSPTARHRIRNEKKSEKPERVSTIRHLTSCQLFSRNLSDTLDPFPIHPTQRSSPEG